MKKGKFLALAMASVCMVSTASVFAGCGGGGGGLGGGTQIKVDETKTQIFIGNYVGGYGDAWMAEYKKGFEELYKDFPGEDGKVGVEVIPVPDQLPYTSDNIYNTIEQSSYHLYLSEMIDYQRFLKAGYLYDISDIVTTNLPNENKTIESKLTKSQQEYFKKEGKYYGLPHYRAYSGLIYDIDLFNQKSLYIKADGSISGKSTDTDLSYGPNGVKGGGDDGLPATYDEFFEWCDYVSNYKDVIPICMTGSYKGSYSELLLENLFVDAQGATGAQLKYSVGTEPVSTEIITGFDGDTPITSTASITRDNYLDVCKSSGLYYALDFLNRIIEGDYFHSMSYNETQTNDMTHYEFLHSRFDPNKTPIAMMIEGTWWEEEANDTFESMAEDYDGAARSERNFGLLPLPKVDDTQLGAQTLFDYHNSVLMMNGNCKGKEAELAKKFIQYISTDEALQLFHTTTGIGRDYQYELTPAQEASLSSFGKSVYNLTKGTEVIYRHPANYTDYTWLENHKISYWQTNAGEEFSTPINGFTDKKSVSAKEYFQGIYNYWKEN